MQLTERGCDSGGDVQRGREVERRLIRQVGMDPEDVADVASGRPFLGLVGNRHDVHRLAGSVGGGRGESVAGPFDRSDRERP